MRRRLGSLCRHLLSPSCKNSKFVLSIRYELKIDLFFNLDQFCDIFHIILKSLPGSVVFLFYLTEFRLKMIKLICLVFLLLNGLAGPGKLQAPFSCLPISPRLFWSLWRSRCPGELPPGTGECTLESKNQSMAGWFNLRGYFNKNTKNAHLVERVPNRLEPVVSVNAEEVSARQKVLWRETILILGS